MQGLFGALQIAQRGLAANQIGMQITGHNISNANTPGYSRQRVELTEALPLQIPPNGVLGMGVEISSIIRIRNTFIDQQLSREQTLQGYYSQLNDYMTQVEATINEPGDTGLNSRINTFFNAWQEVSKYPANSSMRIAMAENGKVLTEDISAMYTRLDAIKTDINDNIYETVNQINEMAEQIASLNDGIAKLEVTGDHANDYRDQRDKLVEEMAKMVNIETSEQADGTINVYIPGFMIVNGVTSAPLEAQVDGTIDRYRADLFKIGTPDGMMDINVQGGKLKALLDMRDGYVNDYQNDLNYIAQTLADSVNELQTSGYDLNGNRGEAFFDTGNKDGTSIYKITAGTSLLDITDVEKPLNDDDNLGMLTVSSGIVSINGINVSIDAEHDSLKTIVTKINNANTGVSASIGPMNRLVLRADVDSGFKITSIQDLTSNLFEKLNILSVSGAYPENSLAVGAGIEFTPSDPPAQALKINNNMLTTPSKIAAAVGIDTDNDGVWDTPTALNDGTNALNIAQIQDQTLMQSGKSTINVYYQRFVTKIGFDSQRAQALEENQTVQVTALEERREAVSGVSLDEEMANMIQYQNAYAASARFMSSVQEMLDALVNSI